MANWFWRFDSRDDSREIYHYQDAAFRSSADRSEFSLKERPTLFDLPASYYITNNNGEAGYNRKD